MNVKKTVTLPAVALRGVVLFPQMTLHFDVGRKESVAALKSAMNAKQDVFFVTQIGLDDAYPDRDALYPVGVIGSVRQIIRIPGNGNSLRVVVDGHRRARLTEVIQNKPFLSVSVEPVEETQTEPEDAAYCAALVFRVRQLFEAYCEHSPQLAGDVITGVYSTDDIAVLSDCIAGNIMMLPDAKQELLECTEPIERMERLCVLLSEAIEILQLDESIQERVQEAMDANQRDYYLREQLHIIEEELGEDEESDVYSFMEAIAKSAMSDDAKEKLTKECHRLQRMQSISPDYHVLRTYIEKCLEIPWGKYTKEKNKIAAAAKVLDKDHYGLRDVKERILEYLAVHIVAPDIKGQIICLAGPPGVGKTSIARSIAAATGRNYVRMSLGGVRDEAEIRGHRRTYVGAIPGRIVEALINAKSMNPLILLDEIDKLSSDFKGDPSSALLEALDAEQNFAFRDHYVELPIDLSSVLFITTANDKHAIPDALRDRMEVIDLSGYTYEEKFRIAKQHLLPKQMKQHALTKSNFRVTDEAIRTVIDGYTREAGVRELERFLAKLCRKESMRLANGNEEKLTVDNDNLESLLGVRKFHPDEDILTDRIGVVNGLAWTAVGGELLQAEALVMDGTGKLELTGSLGDVMKESVRAAVSYIRSRCAELHIDAGFYKDKDIHVHFPEGAVPKDGPSAGITVTTALVSALAGCPVNGHIAMTGEVTLCGRVLPIGGLREKSMAAYRAGIPTVIIPAANVPDLQEVDEIVKEKITFIPVRDVREVLDMALLVSDKETDNPVRKQTVLPKNYPGKRGIVGELQ